MNEVKIELIVEQLQKIRKENPNNFEFGGKVRKYLESLDENLTYVEPRISL
jgi:hypothetical protein